MGKKLSSKQRQAVHANRRAQAARNELLNACARRAGWMGWSQYSTAVLKGSVTLADRPSTAPAADPADAHEQETK